VQPIRVYLDSSDYSLLSDPRRSTPQLSALLQQLRDWVAAGRINCVFSGTHLSEMAPLDANFTDAAVLRAELLSELCGRHALISQDRLFAGELAFALKRTDQPPNPHSQNAEWFPEGSAEISPVGLLQIATGVRDAMDNLHLSRKARRLAGRKTLRDGKPRAKLHAALVKNARTAELGELLAKYPMRPQDARIIARYIVDDATAAEATEAFRESLRDPRWMMRWFSMHHGQLTPFIEWVRGPANTILSSLSQMADHAESVRLFDQVLGTTNAEELFSSSQWREWQDQLLLSVATRLLRALLGQSNDVPTLSLIDEHCPGLSTGIRALHSAWWTVTSKTPREAKLSDFPDALHAMYAPYVQVFRADSFMAPYVARYARRFGTTVVPKLADLLPTLHALLP
jgi:hypothetical protein